MKNLAEKSYSPLSFSWTRQRRDDNTTPAATGSAVETTFLDDPGDLFSRDYTNVVERPWYLFADHVSRFLSGNKSAADVDCCRHRPGNLRSSRAPNRTTFISRQAAKNRLSSPRRRSRPCRRGILFASVRAVWSSLIAHRLSPSYLVVNAITNGVDSCSPHRNRRARLHFRRETSRPHYQSVCESARLRISLAAHFRICRGDTSIVGMRRGQSLEFSRRCVWKIKFEICAHLCKTIWDLWCTLVSLILYYGDNTIINVVAIIMIMANLHKAQSLSEHEISKRYHEDVLRTFLGRRDVLRKSLRRPLKVSGML